jgi:hypothetical protein
VRYLSVCSGKACTRCGEEKPLSSFHKHPGGPQGRHSWCKECANAAQRGVRKRKDTTENRRERLLKQRYGLTSADKMQMLANQGGVCAICREVPNRPVIDHCHGTGKVRGILCHKCNIKLSALERVEFMQAALAYLGRDA